MIEKLHTLWPEIALFTATCVVMIVGLSPRKVVRDACGWIAGGGLLVALFLALTRPAWSAFSLATALPEMAGYGKAVVCAVGLLLVLLLEGSADREYEDELAGAGPRGGGPLGRAFEAIRSTRAEFYAFFLFSLTGLMLCAGSTDLIFLFLALELTSLPTYVMVALSTRRDKSLESSVKYFYLGALGAAVFLYGFALLYGATGSTHFAEIGRALAGQVQQTGSINGLALAGLVLSMLGVCFKIAAVPMHFYTPDVYQGSSAPVAAMLAFVPKAAGFFALISLAALAGWSSGPGGEGLSLPEPLRLMLWVIAALTMTVGNVLALLQTSVKRMLACSSIAHSGYMLVGIIAGPGPGTGSDFARNGLAAVLFYLLVYGITSVGSFGVLACLERWRPDGSYDEIDSLDDLRGLCASRPLLGWTMVISSVGLLGLPPLLGFLSKLPLFTAGISAGEIGLVLVLGLNSAIGAVYYLRLAAAPLLEPRDPLSLEAEPAESPFATRQLASVVSAGLVVLLAILGGGSSLAVAAGHAASYRKYSAPAADEARADVEAHLQERRAATQPPETDERTNGVALEAGH